ncbi:T6SS immunity protein Tli3 family protein [Caballeronia sp.]|uniref:T6SS immunity protein Tli3 family protein n=1 Tax=Caballeronia sp. TaxID=1931223 RepID=UPI003C6EBD84
MNCSTASLKPLQDCPEKFVYHIDNHRYIAIKGKNGCGGTIYYDDTCFRDRPAVTATGLTLGAGSFAGHYAIDSGYVAIPVIELSQTSEERLYIYLATDDGVLSREFCMEAAASGPIYSY